MSDYSIGKNIALCFLHIPKAGGTSIRQFFGAYFGERIFDCYWASLGRTIEDLLWLREKEKTEISCLFGHYFFGTERLLKKKSLYMTVLRQPVQRIISQYLFQLQTNSLPNHFDLDGVEHGEKLSKIIASGDFQYNNIACRMISGVGNRDIPPDEILDIALDNIANDFIFVGTLEDEFIESKLSIILDIFGTNKRKDKLQRLNLGVYKSDIYKNIENNLELKEFIMANNSADCMLYKRFNSIKLTSI
jgi:hypothetical protein